MPDIFRKAVDGIMRGRQPPWAEDGEPTERPESHGWLRRSDHDVEEGEAWERPDGTLRLVRTSKRRAAGEEPRRDADRAANRR